MVRWLSRFVVVGAVWLPAAAPAVQAVDATVAGELRLQDAAAAGDAAALASLVDDAGVPGPVRGRALWRLFRMKSPPLSPADRLRLKAALGDPEPVVRAAAARAVGLLGERPLERAVLARVEGDESALVRAEALRAVRRWTRLGHLYYLEQGLRDPAARVRAEALAGLARLEARDLRPDLLDDVGLRARTAADPAERGAALDALARWGRLDWEAARGTVVDPAMPDPLRVAALELADRLPPADDRDEVLLGLLSGARSLALAWAAFSRLEAGGVAETDLAPAVARFLAGNGQDNAATRRMAAYLERQGYRVAFEAGVWRASAR